MSGSLRLLAAAAAVGTLAGIVYFARTNPGIFTDSTYLGAFLLLQIIVVGVWHYEKLFFPLLMFMFVWAGTGLPYHGAGVSGRWLILAVAAFAGCVKWMKYGRQPFQAFHLMALVCVAAALVSAIVSAFPEMALLKAFSLLLLFLYGSTGARLAVLGREGSFIEGLVSACELSVHVTWILYFVFQQTFFGNSNSLGAVMGVFVAPILLWATLVARPGLLRQRRAIALVISWVLLYYSLSRAGIAAAALSSAILCVASGRRRLLIGGAFVFVILFGAAQVAIPQESEQIVSSFRSSVIYKGKEREGFFGSRRRPWQKTLAVIHQHPWFGSGFGTSDVDVDRQRVAVSSIETKEEAGREHGSSYLALLEWVGLLGVLPFTLLFALLLRRIATTFAWLHKSGDSNHYSIPIALVLTSGLVHGFFEDWIVAVGYYLTVLFWSFAFILIDLAPRRPTRQTQTTPSWRAAFEVPAVAVGLHR